MANHHMTDKGPIPFTADEEIKWAEKEAIADKKRKEEMEEYERVKYQRDRKAEYPTIDECVHAILDGELDALQAKRKIVKERHPKGDN
tara:strand:+ start:411 stop:674 length:264 start_codon:yes stop_codon:yes gene_type:complete